MADEVAFAEFDAAHPEVYEEFKKYARVALSHGFTKYSPDRIIHVARWQSDMTLGPKQAVRVNDRFTTHYARKLVKEDARFAGFFIFRSRQ